MSIVSTTDQNEKIVYFGAMARHGIVFIKPVGLNEDELNKARRLADSAFMYVMAGGSMDIFSMPYQMELPMEGL